MSTTPECIKSIRSRIRSLFGFGATPKSKKFQKEDGTSTDPNSAFEFTSICDHSPRCESKQFVKKKKQKSEKASTKQASSKVSNIAEPEERGSVEEMLDQQDVLVEVTSDKSYPTATDETFFLLGEEKDLLRPQVSDADTKHDSKQSRFPVVSGSKAEDVAVMNQTYDGVQKRPTASAASKFKDVKGHNYAHTRLKPNQISNQTGTTTAGKKATGRPSGADNGSTSAILQPTHTERNTKISGIESESAHKDAQKNGRSVSSVATEQSKINSTRPFKDSPIDNPQNSPNKLKKNPPVKWDGVPEKSPEGVFIFTGNVPQEMPASQNVPLPTMAVGTPIKKDGAVQCDLDIFPCTCIINELGHRVLCQMCVDTKILKKDTVLFGRNKEIGSSKHRFSKTADKPSMTERQNSVKSVECQTIPLRRKTIQNDTNTVYKSPAKKTVGKTCCSGNIEGETLAKKAIKPTQGKMGGVSDVQEKHQTKGGKSAEACHASKGLTAVSPNEQPKGPTVRRVIKCTNSERWPNDDLTQEQPVQKTKCAEKVDTRTQLQTSSTKKDSNVVMNSPTPKVISSPQVPDKEMLEMACRRNYGVTLERLQLEMELRRKTELLRRERTSSKIPRPTKKREDSSLMQRDSEDSAQRKVTVRMRRQSSPQRTSPSHSPEVTRSSTIKRSRSLEELSSISRHDSDCMQQFRMNNLLNERIQAEYENPFEISGFIRADDHITPGQKAGRGHIPEIKVKQKRRGEPNKHLTNHQRRDSECGDNGNGFSLDQSGGDFEATLELQGSLRGGEMGEEPLPSQAAAGGTTAEDGGVVEDITEQIPDMRHCQKIPLEVIYGKKGDDQENDRYHARIKKQKPKRERTKRSKAPPLLGIQYGI